MIYWMKTQSSFKLFKDMENNGPSKGYISQLLKSFTPSPPPADGEVSVTYKEILDTTGHCTICQSRWEVRASLLRCDKAVFLKAEWWRSRWELSTLGKLCHERWGIPLDYLFLNVWLPPNLRTFQFEDPILNNQLHLPASSL